MFIPRHVRYLGNFQRESELKNFPVSYAVLVVFHHVLSQTIRENGNFEKNISWRLKNNCISVKTHSNLRANLYLNAFNKNPKISNTRQCIITYILNVWFYRDLLFQISILVYWADHFFEIPCNHRDLDFRQNI